MKEGSGARAWQMSPSQPPCVKRGLVYVTLCRLFQSFLYFSNYALSISLSLCFCLGTLFFFTSLIIVMVFFYTSSLVFSDFLSLCICQIIDYTQLYFKLFLNFVFFLSILMWISFFLFFQHFLCIYWNIFSILHTIPSFSLTVPFHHFILPPLSHILSSTLVLFNPLGCNLDSWCPAWILFGS